MENNNDNNKNNVKGRKRKTDHLGLPKKNLAEIWAQASRLPRKETAQ